MRLLIASEDSGCVKECIANRGTNTAVQTGLQPLHLQSHLAQGLLNHVQKILQVNHAQTLLGRANGNLELVKLEMSERELTEEDQPKFEVGNYEVQASLEGLFDAGKLCESSKNQTEVVDKFVELYALPGAESTYVAATKSGLLHFFTVHDGKLCATVTHELKGPVDFVQLYDLSSTMKEHIFAYGGEENQVKIVEVKRDLSHVTQIWACKNVPNDRLDLKVPIWPVALKFFGACEESNDSKLNLQFLTISRYAHLRFYQTNHGRKPVKSIDLLPKKESLVSLQLVGDLSPLGNAKSSKTDEFSIITTDTKTNVFQFSTSGQLLGKFGSSDITGFSSVAVAHKQRYLLQGGLDRYLRVFRLKDRELLMKVYTGGKITDVILLDEADIKLPSDPKDEKKHARQMRKKSEMDELEANDDIWLELDSKKKKRKV
ncbi:HER019Wp [Eremothecium sinecaudum]|uniref:Ribosome biogenesis protein NSA1 n=1 Tax=Eremothecium sinecaudum TaxID=45286 RepID=A0A109UZM5_9SACH|nr:HER019Wp [Eremothecium sinecaudum]AMD21298.1 HER019Wp [Eremothecium sinecaudum]